MKKKFAIFAGLLCAILILTVCSKQSRGVPQSVILRDAETRVEHCTNYKIKHDVDTAAHTDNVELELYYKGKYGTTITTIPYCYQHNRSSDIWTLIEEGRATSEQTLNESAYINTSPWTGETKDCYYNISFERIDTKEMIAIIDCKIDFKKANIPDYSKRIAVEIIKLGGTYNLHIEINCSYTEHIGNGYTATRDNYLWFWLDPEYGLQPS